jgi:hypothetical protein
VTRLNLLITATSWAKAGLAEGGWLIEADLLVFAVAVHLSMAFIENVLVAQEDLAVLL